MSIAVGDIAAYDQSLFQYGIGEYFFATLYSVTGLLGCVMNAVVLVANIFEESNPNTILILSACVSEFLLSICIFIIPAFNIFLGEFTLRESGCKFTGSLLFSAVINFGLSSFVDLIAVFSSVCYQYRMTKDRARVIMILVWTTSILFALLPYIWQSEDRTYCIRPSKILCFIRWSSKESFVYPLTLIMAIIMAIIPPIFQYLIWKMTQTFINASRSRNAMDIASNNSGSKSNVNLNTTRLTPGEQLVLHKGRYGSLTLLLWIPYGAVIYYELISSEDSNQYIDSLAIFLLLASLLTKLTLNVHYETRLRSNTKRLLLKIWGFFPNSIANTSISVRRENNPDPAIESINVKGTVKIEL